MTKYNEAHLESLSESLAIIETFEVRYGKKLYLRWLETVSSAFQDLEFDGSLQPLYTC